MKNLSIVGLILFLFGMGCTTDEAPQKKVKVAKTPKSKTVKKTKINSSPLPPEGVERPVVKKK
jgi:PBP1b-binding outer membrane lipoprotein LpoB